MSGKDMQFAGETNVYPATAPPPYSPPRPAPGPTVVETGSTTVVHQGATTVVHGPGVVTVQPPVPSAVVVRNPIFPTSTAYTCPSCNKQIVTRVEYRPTMQTHLCALLLCCIGCWPCLFLPYCMDTCNNADHYCPNCNAYIRTYTR